MEAETKPVSDKEIQRDPPGSLPLEYFTPTGESWVDRFKSDRSVLAFIGILLGVAWSLFVGYCIYLFDPDFGRWTVPLLFFVWLICTGLLVIFGEPQRRNSKRHALWSGFTAVAILQFGLYATIMIADLL